MSVKLTLRLLCCAVFMIALRGDTNWVVSQTKTFATPVGAAAQAMITGDPGTITNTVSVCGGIPCSRGSTTSPPGHYNWSTSQVLDGECRSPFYMVGHTVHFYTVGTDTESMTSNGSHPCGIEQE